jgi:NAD+ diphosphatase
MIQFEGYLEAQMIPNLDRSEGRRANEAALTAAVVDPCSRFILLNGDRALLSRDTIEPVVFTGKQIGDWNLPTHAAVLLGFDSETAWFGLDVQDASPGQGEADEFTSYESHGEFVPLGLIEAPVEQETWALLSQASALLAWNRATAHCPICGSPTVARNGGYHRLCIDSGCGRTHFPRTDPAVIVRVLHGDRCLLARQPRFRPGLRSVIAGFVEPGESLEVSVRRETSEEVGLEVGDIRYLGSQPWPFPMSMMIAFEARALSDVIHIDGNELEAADWFTRDEVNHEILSGRLVLPSVKSIARRMIDGWLAEQEST